MESNVVSGVAYSRDEAKMTLTSVADRPGIAAAIFVPLSEAGVNVDMIVQSSGKENQNTISFTVPRNTLRVTREVVDAFLAEQQAGSVEVDEKIATISAVGIGMKSHSGVAASMFDALAKNEINIEMISTSEIKITVAVKEEQGRKALEVVHDAFGLGDQPAQS